MKNCQSYREVGSTCCEGHSGTLLCDLAEGHLEPEHYDAERGLFWMELKPGELAPVLAKELPPPRYIQLTLDEALPAAA